MEKKAEPNQAYNVYVKEGQGKNTKYVKVASNLPKGKAFTFGHQIVENTTGVSFQLKKAGKTKEADIPYNTGLKEQYQKNKRPETLRYVEKSKYRINTLGEQQGLSVARYLADKKRGNFNL